jgi:hypothetical protein
MDGGLIPKIEDLVCVPGDTVIVERLTDEGFEKFIDTVSCVEIVVEEGKWAAYYFFEKYDNEAKHFEIKEIRDRVPRTNPIPTPKYTIGDVLKYQHSWEVIQRYNRVEAFSIIWQHRGEDEVKYIADRPSDYISERDVIEAYVVKGTPCPKCTEK